MGLGSRRALSILAGTIIISAIVYGMKVKGLGLCNRYPEKIAPKHRVDVEMYQDTDNLTVVLRGNDYTIIEINPTGSMFHSGENTLIAKPVYDVSDLQVGDIIALSYYDRESNEQKALLHSIVKIGYDGQGWYCITKGDTNCHDDYWWLGKVRPEQIEYVVVAVIF